MPETRVHPNPYLAGNYAPVTEELTVADLAVTGHLPVELQGRYLRIGPNPLGQPDAGSYHWFTGDGMVHGIRLRDGRAEWYRNRWVRSAAVATSLGEPVRPGPVHADMDFASNTNVIGLAGRTYALVEAGARPYQLTDDLETVGPSDLDGTLPGGYTAHPKRDPVTGELHAISYFYGWGSKVQYSVVGTDGRVRHTTDVDVGGPVSIHDMSLTERFAVAYDLPVVFDLDAAMAGSSFPYHWDSAYRSRIGLVPRDGAGGDARWFDIEPCYVFHALNAYDDGERVVLDVVRHDNVFLNQLLGPDEGVPPALHRWTVDLATGRVHDECLDDRGQEFPRVDERVVGRRHRFGYTAGFLDGADVLIKHDLERGTSEVRTFAGGGGGAEAVFVPRTPDAAEDDGWVLVLRYDPDRDASDLLVLDARAIDGEPRATVHLPCRVPFGFHGNWVPDHQQ